MPAFKASFHLGDLLRILFSYRADQQTDFDKQVDERTVELLRRSDRLTEEQKELLDDALKAEHSINQIRHFSEQLAGFSDPEWERSRAFIEIMLHALGQSPTERRSWNTQKWAKHLKCRKSDVPAIGGVVKLFDYQQIGSAVPFCRTDALREIRAERDVVIEDGDEIVPPIWQHAVHEVLKHATADISIVDLGWYVTRDSVKGLETTDQVSKFIAELHTTGFTERLLADLWESYPVESQAMGLPIPTSKSPTAKVDGKAEKTKPKRERGRPADTDRTADNRVWHAWKSGEYRKYADLASQLRMKTFEVRAAIDRVRKRRANAPE